ncbi:MAG: redoxin family protein [Bacteroidota bacterium]
MKFSYWIIPSFLIFLFACQPEDKKLPEQTTILSTKFAKVGEEVTVKFIPDSIKMDVRPQDSLFFFLFFQKSSRQYDQTYIPIIDGKGTFVVPENTLYMNGFFYTGTAVDNKWFLAHVVDERGIPVPNAFSYMKGDTAFLNKELSYHGDNLPLSVYAEQISGLNESHLGGKVSDSLVQARANEYLKLVKSEAALETADDIGALATLTAHTGDFKRSEQLILRLLREFPSDSVILTACMDLFSAKLNSGKYDFKNVRYFEDSLKREIAAKNILSSPLALHHTFRAFNGTAPDKFFSDEQCLEMTNYLIRESIPHDINLRYSKVDILIRQKKYKEARQAARQVLKYARQGMGQHTTPMNLFENGAVSDKAVHNNDLAIAYRLLSGIADSTQNLEQALTYLDSAIFYDPIIDKSNLYDKGRLIKMHQNRASLLSRLGRSKEGLSSYEALYRFYEDDEIWELTKVFFTKNPGLGDFEDYKRQFSIDYVKEVEKLSPSPDFSLVATDSNTYTLDSLTGKVIVLNFWASYCGPCLREIPQLNQLVDELREQDVVFLNVTTDNIGVIERLKKRKAEMFSTPSVTDSKKIFNRFEIQYIPTQIVINGKGEIAYRQTSFTEESIKNLGAAIEKALNTPL